MTTPEPFKYPRSVDDVAPLTDDEIRQLLRKFAMQQRPDQRLMLDSDVSSDNDLLDASPKSAQ